MSFLTGTRWQSVCSLSPSFGNSTKGNIDHTLQVPKFTFGVFFFFFQTWNFTKWIRWLESSPQSQLIPIIFGNLCRKYKMTLRFQIYECYYAAVGFELSKFLMLPVKSEMRYFKEWNPAMGNGRYKKRLGMMSPYIL